VARLAFCSVGFFYVAQPSSYDVECTPVASCGEACSILPYLDKDSRFHDVVTMCDFFMYFHCIYLDSQFHDVTTMVTF
jgi:hypothetical protein